MATWSCSTALARALLDRFSPDFLELADTGADYLAALVLLPRPITAAQRERRRRMVYALAHKTTYIKREKHTNCHLGAYAPARIPLAY